MINSWLFNNQKPLSFIFSILFYWTVICSYNCWSNNNCLFSSLNKQKVANFQTTKKVSFIFIYAILFKNKSKWKKTFDFLNSIFSIFQCDISFFWQLLAHKIIIRIINIYFNSRNVKNSWLFKQPENLFHLFIFFVLF